MGRLRACGEPDLDDAQAAVLCGISTATIDRRLAGKRKRLQPKGRPGPKPRYNVTDHGLHTAMFLTRVHERLLPTGLAHLAERSTSHRLLTAATAYRRAIDDLSNETCLAA